MDNTEAVAQWTLDKSRLTLANSANKSFWLVETGQALWDVRLGIRAI
jgi:hypothetical protein